MTTCDVTFFGNPVAELTGPNSWRLTRPFQFQVECAGRTEEFKVPRGFKTDFASVPRFLWWLFPPTGRYAPAAIPHDWMYTHAVMSKWAADQVFLAGMRTLGVAKWKRRIMYLAVRVGGRGNY